MLAEKIKNKSVVVGIIGIGYVGPAVGAFFCRGRYQDYRVRLKYQKSGQH